MQREINIHPISDSDGSTADDAEFESVQGSPSPSASARSNLDAAGSAPQRVPSGRGTQAALKPDHSNSGYGATSSTNLAKGGPTDYDDSLRIRDLDTGREFHFQQVSLHGRPVRRNFNHSSSLSWFACLNFLEQLLLYQDTTCIQGPSLCYIGQNLLYRIPFDTLSC